MSVERDCILLLNYLHSMPNSIKQEFVPYLLLIKKEQLCLHQINQFVSNLSHSPNPLPKDTIWNVLNMLKKLLGLNRIVEYMKESENRINQTIRSFQKCKEFDKIDLINPDYECHYKLSKLYGDHALKQHEKKSRQSTVHEPPRFMARLLQFDHYQSSFRERGNIMYIEFTGTIITGRRLLAVASENHIQIWQKEIKAERIISKIAKKLEEENKQQTKDPKKPQPAKEEVEQEYKEEDKQEFKMTHKFIGSIGKVTSLAISRDQYYLVSGSADRTVRLWCLRLKTLMAEYKGHMGTVWDVDFSPTGYYFLSGSADGMMMLWRSNYPQAQRIFKHRGDVYKVSFARNSDFVISASEDCSLKIWAVSKAQCLRDFKLTVPVINFCLSFSGCFLSTIETDGTITIYNLAKGEKINEFSLSEDPNSEQAPSMPIHDACFSEDEREFTCITSKYVFVCSMDRLSQKMASNVFKVYSKQKNEGKKKNVQFKEVINMGRKVNLTNCFYCDIGVLVVAGTKCD